MNETLARIRFVFNESGLTQTEIGSRIHKTPQYIWKLLNDDSVNPSDSVISDICRVFSINEFWLRTGEGEKDFPLEDKAAATVAALLDESNPLFDLIFNAVKTYMQLDSKSRTVIDNFILELKANNKEN